jgi:two-component system, cell cycle response regulator
MTTIHDQDTAVTDVTQSVVVPARNDCLVVIHDRHTGRQGKRFDMASGTLRIGREDNNDVVFEDSGVSRAHARVERRGVNWVIMDVGSTNGTLVNDERLMGIRTLQNGDHIRLGSMILKYLSGNDIEAAFHEEIYRLAIVDSLTGLPNRRRFDEELCAEFVRARRYGRVLSLLLVDVDLFKQVNDEYGHPTGDSVLGHLGGLLRSRLRSGDLAARVGGEEFAVLMPETPLSGALALAEQLRSTVERSSMVYEVEIRVTVSIGCAELDPADTAAQELFTRCDGKLYEAKKSGRNRVAA